MHGISSPYPPPLLTFPPTTFGNALLACFQKAGILDKELDVVCYNDDPFLEVEAINVLEDVSRLLEYKGHGQETLCVGSFIDTIVTLNQSA